MDTPLTADVVIAGAGPAGIAAAVCAARNGARAVLIEKSTMPGGMSTAGMINLFCNHADSGFFEEVKRAVVHPDDAGRLLYDPEEALSFYLERLEEAGVSLLLDAQVTEVQRQASSIASVRILSRGKWRTYAARVYIDATGDGDLAYLAGVPFHLGRETDGAMQPVSMMVTVGGVDPGIAEHVTFGMRPAWQALLRAKVEAGEVPAPAGHVILIPGPRPGYVTLNMTNAIGVDGTDPEAYTRAQLLCRKQVKPLVRFLRECVPGYAGCYLIKTAVYAGVRESRHFEGDYVLDVPDLEAGRVFEDWCVRGVRAPINIHNMSGSGKDQTARRNDMAYTIPFRSLLPKGINNLLLAGRNIAGTHAAHGSYRLMPICFAMGQAAGTAAALCSLQGLLPRELPIEALQSLLLRQGA